MECTGVRITQCMYNVILSIKPRPPSLDITVDHLNPALTSEYFPLCLVVQNKEPHNTRDLTAVITLNDGAAASVVDGQATGKNSFKCSVYRTFNLPPFLPPSTSQRSCIRAFQLLLLLNNTRHSPWNSCASRWNWGQRSVILSHDLHVMSRHVWYSVFLV